MRVLVLLLLLPILSYADVTYGEGADKTKLVSISKLLSNASDFKDKTITVSGEITAVCKKRGCWMTFKSDVENQSLKIKVKDGDMVFPVAAKGKKGLATGVLVERKMDLEQTRQYYEHIAEEQGTTFDPNSITEALTLYQLNPTGVTILD